eukprot:324007-Rhodomonas_salina.1
MAAAQRVQSNARQRQGERIASASMLGPVCACVCARVPSARECERESESQDTPAWLGEGGAEEGERESAGCRRRSRSTRSATETARQR